MKEHMITEVKYYACEEIPEIEDLRECKEIAEKNDCIVVLQWYVMYSGTYSKRIKKDSNIEEIYESMKNLVYSV